MVASRYHPPPAQPGQARATRVRFAATHFEHAHLKLMVAGLTQAGATLAYVYEPTREHLGDLLRRHPDVRVVSSFDEILADPEVELVASAAVPNERAELGLRVMRANKDYFTAKPAFTSFAELERVRGAVEQTGRKYAVFFSERLYNEATWHAGELLKSGALGSVLSVVILAPHQLRPESRPEWFFRRGRSGGILHDLGSHQFEQFLHFCSADSGSVDFASVANLQSARWPEFEDFGEARLTLSSGASCYCRVDWLSPSGLGSWGDGRAFVQCSQGTLEIRKNLDVGRSPTGDVLFVVDERDTHVIPCAGRVGYPFFARFLEDIENRTESSMSQAHTFKATELALEAQRVADQARSVDG